MPIYIFIFTVVSSEKSSGIKTIRSMAVSTAFLVLTLPENKVPSSAKLGGMEYTSIRFSWSITFYPLIFFLRLVI